MMYHHLHLDSEIPNALEPLVNGIVQNTRNPITDIRTVCAFYTTDYKDEYKQCIKGGRPLLAAFLVKCLSGKVDTKTQINFIP